MTVNYWRLGYDAFHNGIRDPEDDPAYMMAILAESDEFRMNPHDDWNEGWWFARLDGNTDERN